MDEYNEYLEALKAKAAESEAKGHVKTAAEITYRIENELTSDGFEKKGFGYSDKKDIMTRAQRLIKEGWSKSDALTLANVPIIELSKIMPPKEKWAQFESKRGR